MTRNGTITLSELKRVFRRYWWILPAMMLLAGTLGFIATLVLPKKYTSTTMVLVEPPVVSQDVIPATVVEDLYRHMASMREQILSRSGLQPIIEKFNLYPGRRGSEHMEGLVERLKKSIDVELIQPMPGSGAASKQPPGFHISVTFTDPQLAMNICQEVTSMFMERNFNISANRARHTTEFLTQQLAESKANLDQQDAKLAQFKKQYLGSLPEEQQSNLSLLTGMNTQLEAATQALSRAQQDKTFNESLLAQQEAAWKSVQLGNSNPDTLEQQLAALQDQLSALLAKYTPEHPDVIKVKAQIEDTKRRISAGPEAKGPSAGTQASTHEPPTIQQLRARIKQDDLSISDLTKHQTQIQVQIHALQARIQSSPMVEQQLKELTRNYQTALENYNDLLKKQEKSELIGDVESQQEGETFRVLDAPSLPAAPSFPDRIAFVGGGLGAGLVLGLGILYLLAMSDKAMYTERDIEVCLKLPVLTLIPSFDVSKGWHPARSGKAGTTTKALALKP